MKERYFKVHKSFAARAGLNENMRHEADENHLMLSEKDIRMISLTFDEKIAFLGAEEIETNNK